MKDPDRKYIIDIIEGRESGLDYLYEKYGGKIYRTALKFFNVPSVAEEIVADVFLRLWQKRSEINPDYPIGGLIFKITRDYSINMLKKISRRKELRDQFMEDYNKFNRIDPMNDIETDEYLKIIDSAIELLTPKCKKVFKLHYHEKMEMDEISDYCEISINTVKVHINNAKLFLRKYIYDRPDIFEIH